MKCEIIKDLLPLYCDKLTSEVSNEEIEAHLNGCSECSDIYKKMCTKDNADIPDTNVEPLKKVRRKNKLKIIGGFVSGILILCIIFVFAFVGVIPASSEDVVVTYSGRVLENGTLSIEFELNTDNRYYLGARGTRNCIVSDEGIDYTESIDTFYRVFKLPFSDLGGVPGCSLVDFVREDGELFDENDIYTIKFRDKEFTYSLKDIAEECGLQ